MNPMNDPTHPPVPSPLDPPLEAGEPAVRGEWKDAPKVVKAWAYPLTWLSIVLLPLVILAVMLNSDAGNLAERIGQAVLYFLLWAVAIWQNGALKRAAPSAWITQIILSVIGLLGFPLGTIINGYILSQWFQPETKAWFGHK
jgi:hypothetical protein